MCLCSCREFETSYLARDERLPEAVWLPLLSDFDLELAFTKYAKACLIITVPNGQINLPCFRSQGLYYIGVLLFLRVKLSCIVSIVFAYSITSTVPSGGTYE